MNQGKITEGKVEQGQIERGKRETERLKRNIEDYLNEGKKSRKKKDPLKRGVIAKYNILQNQDGRKNNYII